MVIRSKDVIREEKEHVRDGQGSILFERVLTAENMIGTPNMFSRIRFPKGASIGMHRHLAENETFLILSGQGKYHDNGREVIVTPGDVCICKPGETHGIQQDGDEDLVLMAMIQKEE